LMPNPLCSNRINILASRKSLDSAAAACNPPLYQRVLFRRQHADCCLIFWPDFYVLFPGGHSL
jgi:hypothetical protein